MEIAVVGMMDGAMKCPCRREGAQRQCCYEVALVARSKWYDCSASSILTLVDTILIDLLLRAAKSAFPTGSPRTSLVFQWARPTLAALAATPIRRRGLDCCA